MSPETEALALAIIDRIETSIDGVRADLRDVKTRLGWIIEQSACLSAKLDRIDTRLASFDQRLKRIGTKLHLGRA